MEPRSLLPPLFPLHHFSFLHDQGATSKKDCENVCHKSGGDYVCNVELLTCELGTPGQGEDLATCQADCQPHTPTVLVGSWRGLMINQNFTQGEFDFVFTTDNLTVTVGGQSSFYKVRSNGTELTLIDSNGSIRMANYGIAQVSIPCLLYSKGRSSFFFSRN